jgi:hypothetical protein
MRHRDWVARLWETVARFRGVPFAYGQHDCCLFAARCVDAMTGSQHARDLADHYTNERTALRYIHACGGVGPAIAQRLGEPVPGHCARRGDVCLVPVEGGDGVGVCLGIDIAVASERGLLYYPLHTATQHWRVE